jgi:hypothetical protein
MVVVGGCVMRAVLEGVGGRKIRLQFLRDFPSKSNKSAEFSVYIVIIINLSDAVARNYTRSSSAQI